MPVKTGWREVTKTHPCLICGKPDWCARSADGAHRCERSNGHPPDGFRAVGKGTASGTIFRHASDLRSVSSGPPTPPKPAGPRKVWATAEQAADAIAKREGAAVEAIYSYPDADGSCRFWVVRLAPKSFRPLRRADRGIEVGDPIGPLPLYRLPELDQAPAVLVVEGEKVADAAWSVGIAATTSAHGCKSPTKTDWTPLAGKTVYLCPDNDEGGRAYVRTVAQILDDLNPRSVMRLLELPGLPPKGDLADWIDARDSVESDAIREQILALADAAKDGTPKRKGFDVSWASEIEPEEIEWLWPGRIALGKLTLLTGEPEQGKSFVTIDIAARLSRGWAWPDARDEPTNPISTLFVAAEDGKADTIVPRIILSGGARERIAVLNCVRRDPDPDIRHPLDLSKDLPACRDWLESVPEIKLVVIDPLSAYLGEDADSHKDAEVRRVLTPLCDLAEQLHIAIVGIVHLNKAVSLKARYRLSGSAAFFQLARFGSLVAADPVDPNRRLFLPMKANPCRKRPPGLAFRFSDEGLAWDAGEVLTTPDEALAEQKARPALASDDAEAWLRERLAGGAVDVKTLNQEAKGGGFSKRTLDAVKVKMMVRSRCRVEAGQRIWSWELPVSGAWSP